MDINSIIDKKKRKVELESEEIKFFVQGYINNKIKDYHASALIMAMSINGLSIREITDLTLEMANSGDKIENEFIKEKVIGKHSLGGVGDKVTLILMPLISSLGIPVAKTSGRGFGITGGTIDKLESISGYKSNLSIEEYINQVKKIGICINSKTSKFAIANKKICDLRDQIGCEDFIPIMAASIMSKKIAEGMSKLVLDITVGSGAYMKNEGEAIELAETMNKIAKLAGIQTICLITKMEEPLGKTIGNSLEVIEAIKSLKGEMEEDVKEVVLELGAYMLKLAGFGNNIEKNKNMLIKNLENKKGYEKFLELVKEQGGDIEYLKDISKFPKAKYIIPVLSDKSGIVQNVNAEICGSISAYLGAGRRNSKDIIDPAVGIILNKKRGDKVDVGEILAYIHSNDEKKVKGAVANLAKAYEISNKKVKKSFTVIGII